MSRTSLVLAAVLAAFSTVTALALAEAGYVGIVRPHFQSWAGAQVLVDLAVLAVLCCVWMVRDARARGRSAWPYVLVTLLAGSFGPLLYLAVGRLGASRQGGRQGDRQGATIAA